MPFKHWARCGAACRAIFAGAAVALISAPSVALDLEADSARILSDPAFLPHPHQFVSTTGVAYGTDTGEAETAAHAPLYSLKTDAIFASERLSYGLTEELSVGGAVSHASTTTHYAFESGAPSQVRQSASQLQLGVTYRAIDQSTHPVNLDISLYTPGGLSVALSHVTRDFTIEANTGLYHIRNANGFDTARDADVRRDTFWGYFVGVQSQTRLSEVLSFNVSVAYVSSNLGRTNASLAGNSFAIDFPDQVNVGMTFNYHLIPNKLVVQLGATYQSLGTRHDAYADSTLDVLIANRSVRSVAMALIYSPQGGPR
jgi:hypothetical protein